MKTVSLMEFVSMKKITFQRKIVTTFSTCNTAITNNDIAYNTTKQCRHRHQSALSKTTTANIQALITNNHSFHGCSYPSKASTSTKIYQLHQHQHHNHSLLLSRNLSQQPIYDEFNYSHNQTLSTPTSSKSSSPSSSLTPFLLADIGEGIAEVEILQWFVQPGESVAQFDRVCEVQSDKATVEITSRFDGVIHSLSANVGDMVQVGSPLLLMQNNNSNNSSSVKMDDSTSFPINSTIASTMNLNNADDEHDKLSIPTVASSFPNHDTISSNTTPWIQSHNTTTNNNVSDSTTSDTTKIKMLASPAVRKLCKDYNIDSSTLRGTGPSGRILKGDILKYIHDKGLLGPTTTTHNINITKTTTTTAISNDRNEEDDKSSNTKQDKIIPIRGYHRLMVQSMTSTLHVPHMCYSDEVNMTSLRQHRNALKVICESKGVKKLSYLPFAIKAVSLALNEYPILNSSIDVDEMTLTYHSEHKIGIAIDSPKGLVVPVIRNAQDLSILDIALELNRLQEMAQKGSLTEKEIITPTFTLSNIGAIGGTYMSPIVLPPQVAIGAMGKIQRLPRFVSLSDNDDSSSSMQVEEVFLMNISWGGDHRVIDGATLGRFSNLWKRYMEMPTSMLLSMR